MTTTESRSRWRRQRCWRQWSNGSPPVGRAVSSGAELSGAFFDSDRRPVVTSLSSSPGDLTTRLLDALVDSWIPARYASPGFDSGSFVVGIDRMTPSELALAMVVAKGAAKELARSESCDALFMTRRPGATVRALLELDISIDPGCDADTSVVAGLLADARPLLFPSVNAMRAVHSATQWPIRWTVHWPTHWHCIPSVATVVRIGV